jgi:hypothetical protein
MSEVAAIGAELGRQSYGVVSAAELSCAGVDLSVVAALVHCGAWVRLWRGMYRCRPEMGGPLVQAHAAVKHAAQRRADARAQPVPVISGLAGATALGLRWVPRVERVQVLVGPEVHRTSGTGVLVRRCADVAEVPTWNWGGVRVADASRLVVDGARECTSLRDVRGLVLGAVADAQTTPPALRALLDAGAVGGTAWARRATSDAENGAASPPEAELVDGLVGRGHPFYVNPLVRVEGVFLGHLDVYLVGTGVGAEMDSKERHGESADLDATLARHERARAYGVTLLHVTPNRYRTDPAGFVEHLLATVAARREPEPPGLEVIPRGPLLR